MEIARVIRVGYLQQNAFHKDDTFVTMDKQLKMMEIILYLYNAGKTALKLGKTFSLIAKTGIFEKVIKIKYDIPNDHLEMFDDYYKYVDDAFESIK